MFRPHKNISMVLLVRNRKPDPVDHGFHHPFTNCFGIRQPHRTRGSRVLADTVRTDPNYCEDWIG